MLHSKAGCLGFVSTAAGEPVRRDLSKLRACVMVMTAATSKSTWLWR